MKSPWSLHELEWKKFARQLWSKTAKDRVTAQTAQLAFYFLLSAFPLLLALTALAGSVLKSDFMLLSRLEDYLRAVAPESVAGLLVETVQETATASSAGKISLGLFVTVWAASRAMNALIEALNIIYSVQEARPWWRRRLTALALTIGFMALILGAFVMLLYGARLTAWAGDKVGLGGLSTWLATILEWGLGLGFVLMAFNLLYIYAPNATHRRWNWLMPGTLAGVALWLTSSLAFKIYLGYFDRYSVTYGSLGAVIILMIWFYITGLAVLIGAEVNSLIERACGIVPEQKEKTK
jgi:membrane protein